MRGQNLVKVFQTRLKLIDSLETTGLGEIHIRMLIIGNEEYGDKLVLVKFETNSMDKLRQLSNTGTQNLSITSHHSI